MVKEKWNEIAFYYHPIFQEHLVGVKHPENPERLELIKNYLIEKEIWK